MKSIYKFSLPVLAAVFFSEVKLNAQVYQMTTEGLYFPGGVSNTAIASIRGGNSILKWDQANGLVTIGESTSENSPGGNAIISADGTKIAGTISNQATGLNEISLYDVAAQTWETLGGISAVGTDGEVSSSWGISSDGTSIVGLGWLEDTTAHAIKWTRATGMTDLGSQFAAANSRANAVNEDGSVVVGWQDQESGDRVGARWVNGVLEYLLDGDGNTVGEAQGVSADGKTIVGNYFGAAYVWKEGGPFTVVAGDDPFANGGATAVSGDGKIMLGYFRDFGAPPYAGQGFIWTAETGIKKLNEYVTSLGVNTLDINFGLPLAISPDGKKIVGTGAINEFQPTAFLIDLTAALGTKSTTAQRLSIAPNPVKDELTLLGGKVDSAELYNIAGQKVSTIKLINGKADISSLNKGIYILKTTVNGQTESIKLIKE